MDPLALIVVGFIGLYFLYSVIRLAVRDGIRDARSRDSESSDS